MKKSSKLQFDKLFLETIHLLIIVCSVDCMSLFLMITWLRYLKTRLTPHAVREAVFEMVLEDKEEERTKPSHPKQK